MGGAIRNIIDGPTLDAIRDALFPLATATEFPWLTFTMEGEAATPQRFAVQGAIKQGGGMWELHCTDGGPKNEVFFYNTETKKGWVKD